MNRNECLICKSSNLKEIIDLGMHPFADTFIPKEKVHEADKAYPLVCDLCMNCGQIQLRYETSPEDRYCTTDYSYTSSNSNFSRTHWIEYAKEVLEKTELQNKGLVIEIGSNDGFLTKEFISKGFQAIGVDPSEYMASIAKNNGVDTLIEIFTKETAEKINKEKGKANLVIANNVFNHSDNPVEFAKAVSSILSREGFFVFELPYWATSIETKKFDQIYHEHVSYFTAKSSTKIMEEAGMRIFAIEVVNYHGGSLRVYAKLAESLPNNNPEVYEMIKREENQELFNPDTYKIFMQSLNKQKHSFLKKLHELKQEGASLLAVGAPAKGNTFLNFYNLNNKMLDFVTDSSQHKQGKYTPLTRIPIAGDEIFTDYIGKKVYAIITSWNLTNQLKPILEKINPEIKFISPDNFN